MTRVIRNPIGNKVSLGNGYYYQCIRLGREAGYIKVWHHNRVIDRATSVANARKMARRYAERALWEQ